jgi:hypothetical protein
MPRKSIIAYNGTKYLRIKFSCLNEKQWDLFSFNLPLLGFFTTMIDDEEYFESTRAQMNMPEVDYNEIETVDLEKP